MATLRFTRVRGHSVHAEQRPSLLHWSWGPRAALHPQDPKTGLLTQLSTASCHLKGTPIAALVVPRASVLPSPEPQPTYLGCGNRPGEGKRPWPQPGPGSRRPRYLDRGRGHIQQMCLLSVASAFSDASEQVSWADGGQEQAPCQAPCLH